MSAPSGRGRRLHFVGIGGAGMSGLALDRARARRDRSPARTAPTRRTSSACARPGSTARRRPRRGQRARRRRRRARRLDGDRRPTTPSAPRAASAACARSTAARCSASSAACGARSRSPARTARRRRPRWRRTRCWRSAGSRRTSSAASCATTGATNAGCGHGRVARRRGRRVRPLVPRARARDRGRDEHRARPPHDVRLARRARARVRGVPAQRRCACVVADTPEAEAFLDRVGIVEAAFFGASEIELRARRLALRLGRAARSRCRCPGAHNVANAAAALTACVIAGARAGASSPARWPTSPAPGGASSALGETAGRGARRRRLRPPPDRAARDDRAPPARSAAGRVVAVFQPHLFSRTQLLAREFGAALAPADAAVVLDVYPSRERAEDFPGVTRAARSPRPPPTPARGRPVAWAPGFDAAERLLARALRRRRRAASCMGAGDVDALGRRLVGVPMPPAHQVCPTNTGSGTSVDAERLVHAAPAISRASATSSVGRAAAAVGQRERVLGGDRDAVGVAVAAREAGALDEPGGRGLDARASRPARPAAGVVAERARPRAREGVEVARAQDRVREERAGADRVGVGGVEHHALAAAQREHRVAHLARAARARRSSTPSARGELGVADRLGQRACGSSAKLTPSTSQRPGSRLKTLER